MIEEFSNDKIPGKSQLKSTLGVKLNNNGEWIF